MNYSFRLKLLQVLFFILLPVQVSAVVPQRVINEIYPSDETIASLSKVIQSGHLEDSALADVYYERGTHYADLGQYSKSIADLTMAIKLNSRYVTAYISRANAHAKLEQYQQSFQDFATAQQLSPKNTTIYALRGSLNFLLGHFQEAVADFRYYLSLKPDDMYRMLWLYLSEKYRDVNSGTDLAQYSRSMNLDVWPGALLKLYMGQVRAQDFLNAFEKQINGMKPEMLCEGFYYLGQYLLLSGDRQLAADSFRQAVKSNARKTVEYEFALAYLARLSQ